MQLIQLTAIDLAMSAFSVLALALLSWRQRLGVQQTLMVSALRGFVQLLLIGVMLGFLFELNNPAWLAVWALIMLLVAGREVNVRQRHRLRGYYGFALSVAAMFCSSFVLSFIALYFIVGYEPWYQPQYAIPLLGMLLGNTMNGVALSLDRLSQTAISQVAVIEQRLMLGERWFEAISAIRREAVRSGLIPSINGMATAGLVSLPGMMTGQILSGVSPFDAVKYQIMILFLIAAGTGFGVMCATWLAARKMFDERERFLPERLTQVTD
ncbi:MAG: iron export ABC transporter permease subunit FetB [Gammaproteobacteria bacterium]|nr:MAG: iron export ABC transporter permease subunit FetB [Gammaproteobacteria bacterium]